MGLLMTLLRECEQCDVPEERLFTDSYTGMELCLGCLSPIASQITNSPESEGDNLAELLNEGEI